MSKSIQEATRRGYDGTVARIAGNILSGILYLDRTDWWTPEEVKQAVALARAIVEETRRLEAADALAMAQKEDQP